MKNKPSVVASVLGLGTKKTTMNTIRRRTAGLAAAAFAAATVVGAAGFAAAATAAPVAPHPPAEALVALGDAVGSGPVAAQTGAEQGLSLAQALTITFNNVVSSGNPDLTHLSTDGYNFDGLHFHTIDTPALCNLGGCVSNGTIYLAEEEAGVGQPFTMTRGTGGTFRLAKVDLAQLFIDDAAAANAGSPNATTVTLTGTLSPGGILTRSFSLPNVGFGTFALPKTWKHLVSVRFAADGAFGADSLKISQGL